jgi:uncharacterized protein
LTAGLSLKDEELAIVRHILRVHLPESATVHAFGSRVTGRAKPWSDLDLVIEAGSALSLECLAALAEAFDESALPWKVDLVDRANVSNEFARFIDAAKIAVIPF